jgi:hypothetical protein
VMHALRKHSQMLSMTGRPTHQPVAASLGPVFRKTPDGFFTSGFSHGRWRPM